MYIYLTVILLISLITFLPLNIKIEVNDNQKTSSVNISLFNNYINKEIEFNEFRNTFKSVNVYEKINNKKKLENYSYILENIIKNIKLNIIFATRDASYTSILHGFILIIYYLINNIIKDKNKLIINSFPEYNKKTFFDLFAVIIIRISLIQLLILSIKTIKGEFQ